MGVRLNDGLKMHKENENIYIGVIILLAAALAIIGLRMFDAESELEEIKNNCTIYEDGSAVCEDDTFEWKGN